MPFEKGHKYGNRFSSTNQPQRSGRKKKDAEIQSYIQSIGGTISKEQVFDIYKACLSLTEAQLKAILSDKEQPMMFRIVTKEVLSKRGFDIIERIIDRVYGKPKQYSDVTTNGKEIVQEPITIEVIDRREQVEKE